MNIRFAIASDLHIALPETIPDIPNRFHLTQFSISAFNTVLSHLESLDVDFLLLPGDLTQDGEPKNHQWLQEKLESLPYPVYVIPGNHDVPSIEATENQIAYDKFSKYYQNCGYKEYTETLDYTCEIAPNVHLIALNSNHFDQNGQQQGCLVPSQFQWLKNTLSSLKDKIVLVMIHHNIIEHLPRQSKHPLGKRYMLDNAPKLLKILQKHGVKVIFTGHLHIQDVSKFKDIHEVTTGSLITYPSPYRILELDTDEQGRNQLKIVSHQVLSLPDKEDYGEFCREWLGNHSFPFLTKLLTSSPLNMKEEEAAKYARQMRYFWADIAQGDGQFNYPDLPPLANYYFSKFGVKEVKGVPQTIDNNLTIPL